MKMRKSSFNLDETVSTFFGIGRIRFMPGTFGSAAALIIALIIPIHWIVIAATIIIGTWCADRYSKRIGVKDPPEVVIDEVAGMWISMYALPSSFGITAFILFRIVDILKPFPVYIMESLPGGIGIMADDITGGFMVWIVLWIVSTIP